MEYSLSLSPHAAEVVRRHLLGDRSREQMAITLCGINRLHRELRLLARDVILLPPDAFRHQSVAHLELKPEVQAFIHERAHRQGLVQVDWHSHPGHGGHLRFSATDDEHEAAQAAYLAHRMEGIPYGSVVVNDDALDARVWITRVSRAAPDGQPEGSITYRPVDHPLRAVLTGDLAHRIPTGRLGLRRGGDAAALSPVFDRQVRAFGEAFQRRLGELRVGLVGAGGLGSAIAEQLARLGVRDWVLVDPDVVDLTNLNRLVHATLIDAQKSRPKVYVARSSVRQANPKAQVRALRSDVFDAAAQRALKACDLLVVATDNHASRMAVNRLAVQYLIPLLHAGFNISVAAPAPAGAPARAEGRSVTDVSGEFALPEMGRWCLQCAGIVDPQQAGWELAPQAQREILRRRGYVADTPAPAVRHLDGVVASLAVAEVHNLAVAFKPAQRYLAYDALRTELVPLRVTASDACPVCSPDHGVLGLGDLEPMPDYRRASRAVSLPAPRADASAGAGSLTGPDQAAPTDPEEGSDPLGQELQCVTPLDQGPAPDRAGRVRRLQAALDEADVDWP